MAQDAAFQKQVQRIAEMVSQLESAVDPNARALAREFVESLMALHGAGLEQILELTSGAGEEGQTLIRKFGQDQVISSLLLLYGLHPEDLRARVMRALEKNRSYLEARSASAELLSISGEGAVRVRLNVRASGCGSSANALKSTLLATLEDAAPDAISLTVEETGAGVGAAGFVTVEQLQRGNAIAALSAGPLPGNGD